jgi:NAD+ synthase
MLKNKIVDWLYEKATDANKDGFVIGISGGIDSAVASTLCAETGLNVIAVAMPVGKNPKLSRAHLRWLARKYENVDVIEIDLSDVYCEFKMIFSYADMLTMANLKSRIRMVTLYALASENGLLVCGTGNKVEDFGVGFFTKYGDGGVDISPLGDLMKSEVWEMGRELGVLKDIINATPTDGLWEDGRTDEDQIGCSYAELEWAMNYKEGVPVSDRQKRALEIYEEFHNRNRHKMEPIPVFKKN